MSRFDFSLNKKERTPYDVYWAKKNDYSRKKEFHVTSVGISSLLMVFVILCLACFAALAVVSAEADRKLTNKLAQRTSDYYEAANEAEKWLAELDAEENTEYTKDFILSDTQLLRVYTKAEGSGKKGEIQVVTRKVLNISDAENDFFDTE